MPSERSQRVIDVSVSIWQSGDQLWTVSITYDDGSGCSYEVSTRQKAEAKARDLLRRARIKLVVDNTRSSAVSAS